MFMFPSVNSRILVRGREVVVRGVGGRDAGLYQCLAANAIGETQAGSYLGVRGGKIWVTENNQ